MISADVRSTYKPTIGIECHVQLKTATKLFAAVGNDARDAEPNTLISPICLGLPGVLPVLNKEAVHLAIRAAFALGTEPQKYSEFERKHYFYPDLPMGYQISQLAKPIIIGGHVTISVDGQETDIRINRVQLEADAGKSTHPVGKDYSLVDFNRAGTPLLEIVSEPDLHSAAQAKAYARELYLRMRYADVSDCNLYYGNMRFDVNVSVSTNPETFGTRTETKNLNSFRAVEKAVEYEINRQVELLEKGSQVVQETRGWDDAKQRTFTQRTKEDAHDYRYMPDPDIPPVALADSVINAVREEMPVMPAEWRTRLSGLGLDLPAMETLLEAELDSPTVSYLALIEEGIDNKDFAKALANWFVNFEVPLRAGAEAGHINANYTNQGRLSLYRAVHALIKAGKLSSSNAKALLTKLLLSSQLITDVEGFAKQHNLIQESDEGEIAKIVAKVIEENPKAAQDVKDGETKAIGFLVGQVMKHSQGRANPGLASELIKKQLGQEG
ncbi:MAG TPA: Asp-tRNA(Asn)/Glu-tRNA(Gln) amidotransferase subunit GatB [Candidatus Saccharimonadales bacterium]|nr:Asp-tRNA(Asn)/Glu-tRNA(Gln) amidotransferase subunit GatB [Candidatus Saccharimonadales bacterium]